MGFNLLDELFISKLEFSVKVLESPLRYPFSESSFLLEEQHFKRLEGSKIEMKKPLLLQGALPLVLEEVLIDDQFLDVQDFNGPLLVPMNRQVKVFNLHLSYTPQKTDIPKRKIFVPVIASRLYLALPIQIYDRKLSCAVVGEKLLFFRCSDEKLIKLNFGKVVLHDSRQKFLYIKNENPVDVKLFFLRTDNPTLKIFLEHLNDEKGKIISEKKSIKSTGSKSAKSQHLLFKPGYQALILFTLYPDHEESYQGNVQLTTSFVYYIFYNNHRRYSNIEGNFINFNNFLKGKYKSASDIFLPARQAYCNSFGSSLSARFPWEDYYKADCS
jgi:hypothetical protein